MRWHLFLVSLVVLLILTLGACEQLAGFQNNKLRVVGTWQIYGGGFLSDSTYSFDTGIIKKDDYAWGTYSFVKHSEIEVELGGSTKIYTVEFVTDDKMIFYEIIDGKRYDRYEWRR